MSFCRKCHDDWSKKCSVFLDWWIYCVANCSFFKERILQCTTPCKMLKLYWNVFKTAQEKEQKFCTEWDFFQEYYPFIREVTSGHKMAREVGFLLTCHSYWTSYFTAGRGIDSVPYLVWTVQSFDHLAKVWLSTPICFGPAPLHQVCEQILYCHAPGSKTKWWTAVLVHIWYTFFRRRSSLLVNFVDCKEDLQCDITFDLGTRRDQCH